MGAEMHYFCNEIDNEHNERKVLINEIDKKHMNLYTDVGLELNIDHPIEDKFDPKVVLGNKGIPFSIQDKNEKEKKKPAHPPAETMVNAAIFTLKQRKGSSLWTIKKFIASNFDVDITVMAPFIRRYLKKAVASGKIIQVTGSG